MLKQPFQIIVLQGFTVSCARLSDARVISSDSHAYHVIDKQIHTRGRRHHLPKMAQNLRYLMKRPALRFSESRTAKL
jgi:hypothetical protein